MIHYKMSIPHPEHVECRDSMPGIFVTICFKGLIGIRNWTDLHADLTFTAKTESINKPGIGVYPHFMLTCMSHQCTTHFLLKGNKIVCINEHSLETGWVLPIARDREYGETIEAMMDTKILARECQAILEEELNEATP